MLRNLTGKSEAVHQMELARYLRECRDDNPLFTAPCNGIESSSKAKRKAKDMGLQRGVPDLLIFEVRPPYLGLAIELKRPAAGTLSAEQREWIEALSARGWKASVQYGARAALREIRSYLNATERPVRPFAADHDESLYKRRKLQQEFVASSGLAAEETYD